MENGVNAGTEENPYYLKCPYTVGQRIVGKETWSTWSSYDYARPSRLPDDLVIHFKSDLSYSMPPENNPHEYDGLMGKWRPPQHMPEWASRLPLVVTNVWPGRVKDIIESEAMAEGVSTNTHGVISVACIPLQLQAAKKNFKEFWNDRHAKNGHAWDTNPWVWNVECKREEI
jgi:hypothetical protein